MLKKLLFFSLLSLVALPHQLGAFGQKSVFIGNIQFPNSLEMVPSVRVYYAGRKIVCEYDMYGKKITFTIPELKQRTFFYLLVTPEIEFFSHENTVPCLKLKRSYPYKLYALQLVPRESTQKNQKRKNAGNQPSYQMPTVEYAWQVTELQIALPDNRIPDEAIIICYHPDYIESLEGGNAIEFPKILVKNEILKIVGSEEKLHELSDKWFLAALNNDTIHGSTTSEFKIKPQSKTVISMLV